MGKLQKKQNPRMSESSRTSSYDYRCSVCKYSSSRRYNILRHEFRIHSASSRPRQCCDLIFKTKGEFYVHCEENHPTSRTSNRTSRYKYSILPGMEIPRSPNQCAVTALPEKSPEIRYRLRSRARPKNYCEDDTNITLLDSASPKSSQSAEESKSDAEMEHSADLQQSSGYGTKNSISTTFDSTEENDETKLLSSESFNESETINHHNLLEEIIEKIPEESNEPSPTEFSKNEQNTAGFGENTMIGLQKTFNELNVGSSEIRNDEENVNPDESSDITDMTVYPEKSIDSGESNMTESEDLKTSSENELKENYCTLSTSTAHSLPPKKRILLSLGFSNRENIARKVIDDRLYLPKPPKVEQKPLRKKPALSKKMKCRKLRKRINLSKYSPASSDVENVPPTTANVRKQQIPGLKVDLRADGSLTWDEITRLMREHVGLIDFDSFKVTLRRNEHRAQVKTR